VGREEGLVGGEEELVGRRECELSESWEGAARRRRVGGFYHAGMPAGAFCSLPTLPSKSSLSVGPRFSFLVTLRPLQLSTRDFIVVLTLFHVIAPSALVSLLSGLCCGQRAFWDVISQGASIRRLHPNVTLVLDEAVEGWGANVLVISWFASGREMVSEFLEMA
jgi:hypothetical protein